MTTLTETALQPQAGENRFKAYDAVRIILDLLQLTAAALESYALATGPVAAGGLPITIPAVSGDHR